MSHWLDEVARGFSEGSFSRREVLRRGGAVAGGALLASVTGPVGTLTRARAASGPGVPCPDLNSVCFSPDVCCGGDKCINTAESHCCPNGTHDCFNDETCCGDASCCAKDEFCCGGTFCLRRAGEIGCCNGSTYNVKYHQCCPGGRPHTCDKGETCCGKEGCCKTDQLCCEGRCHKRSRYLRCCHDRTYDPKFEHCCPHGRQACRNDETCCGEEGCCRKGEVCCGGKTCCKATRCHNGVCETATCDPPCRSGQKCCPGPGPDVGQGNFCCESSQTCCHKCGCEIPDFLCCLGNCTGSVDQLVCCGQTGQSGKCGTGSTGQACCSGGKIGCVCSGTGTCCVTGDGRCACYPDGTCRPAYGQTGPC